MEKVVYEPGVLDTGIANVGTAIIEASVKLMM